MPVLHLLWVEATPTSLSQGSCLGGPCFEWYTGLQCERKLPWLCGLNDSLLSHRLGVCADPSGGLIDGAVLLASPHHLPPVQSCGSVVCFSQGGSA